MHLLSFKQNMNTNSISMQRQKNGDCILHKYAKEDDGKLNEELLGQDKYKPMMDEVNSNKETPLHVACQHSHLKSVILLVEKGADFKMKDAAGNSPVMTAIAANNPNVLLCMLKAILNREADCTLKEILSLNARNNKTILVWAIESNYTSLIEVIIQLELHLATESDPYSNSTLLHIAAAAGALESIKALLKNKHVCGLLQQCDSEGKMPLMLSAQNGHTDCVKTLHSPGEVNKIICYSSDLNATDKDGHTALHLACLNGHLPVVKHLCAINADLEACEEGSDGTPLACAASMGREEIVSYLLGQDVQVNGKGNTTPLMLAAKNGHDKCVQQLLQHNAVNVSIQDKDGYNCLAIAAKNRQLQPALAIVNSRHWKRALRACDKNNATPLRLLIQYLPDAAEVVLYRCIEENQKDQEVVEIKMSFEFLDDFQDIVAHKSQLHGLFNALHGGGNDEQGFIELQNKNTLPKAGYEDPEIANTKVQLPNKFNRHNHVLHWMVKYERIKLLQHPLTQALISHKWKAYAMLYTIIILALYLAFLTFLTAFSAVMPFPEGTQCKPPVNTTISCEDSSGEQVFLRFAAVILLIFCGIRFTMELLEFIQRRLQYLKDIENYLEMLLIASTAIFAIAAHSANCFCVNSFAWQFGAGALFLGWIDLILYLKRLPLTGIRINMLQTVIMTFLKLVYLPAILIVAFALPFYMLFSREEVENSFHTPGFSLMKSLVMASGELEYEQLFRFRDNPDERPPGALHFIVMSNILWAVFVILMPILFINLLIGLAVDDTQKIEEKATLTYLSLKVDSALEIEAKLPIQIRRMFKLPSIVVKKDSAAPLYLKYYYKLYDGLQRNTFKSLEKEVNQLKDDEKLSDMLQGKEILEPIDEVKAQVCKNADTVSHLQATIEQIKEESKQASAEIGEILCIIKDLRQDLKAKNLHTARKATIHNLKKFIGKSKSMLMSS